MDKSGLCLATWNIHMGVGRDGQRDLGRTARVIQEMAPDLIGLQEVDNRVDDGGNDLSRLEALTGMQIVAGPTMQKATGDYGNAILTRLPVLKVERYDLSVKKREPRGLLIAHLDWQGERLQVAVTHLGLRPGERRNQVLRLIAYLSAEERSPLLLIGDFNEWLFWGRPLRWLHRHFGRFQSPPSFPTCWPLFRLDHILAEPKWRLGPIQAHNSRLSVVASDHLPLTAYFHAATEHISEKRRNQLTE